MTSKLLFLVIATPLIAEEPLVCESYTPGSVCLCDGWGFSAMGEGLLWTAREHSLVLTTSNVGLTPTSQVPPALDRWDFRGELIRIEPSWHFGWRAGAGFTSSCNFWDLFAYWTSYTNGQSEEVELIDLPALNLWGYPDTPNAEKLFAARGKWELKYEVLDIEIGRAFWIGQCLTLRPHFGVRAAWIDQDLDFHFDFQPQNTITFGVHNELNSNFSGAGLRTGFDLDFTSGSGFGLYGRINYALLYGTFDSKLNETEFNAASDDLLIAHSTDDHNMGTAAVQGVLGIHWSECYCQNRYRIGLKAQWEFNHWNDLGKFHHYSTLLQNGIYHQDAATLYLMGLSFGASLDF